MGIPKRKVAVVGAGMTKFVRRAQETGKELTYEASKMALDSCELNLDQVDCVVHGTAPDSFDGVHMKGEYLADGSGAWRKPYTRCYVGGGTGVFTDVGAFTLQLDADGDGTGDCTDDDADNYTEIEGDPLSFLFQNHFELVDQVGVFFGQSVAGNGSVEQVKIFVLAALIEGESFRAQGFLDLLF